MLTLVNQSNNVYKGNLVAGDSHETETGDEAAIFAGLPRQISPRGVDDTSKIIALVIGKYPSLPWYPDQTFNRRAAYMAILSVRQGRKGWQGDKHVEKGESVTELWK